MTTEIFRLKARVLAAEQAEKRLRESEARLKALLMAADLGSWHWNLRTGAVEMNQRYVEMLGYDAGELLQRAATFFDLLHPADSGRVCKALDDHFDGKSDNYSVEIRLRHKEGHWIWVHTTGRVIQRDSRGRPLIMTGTHQDISSRMAERQALEESEARFRETFENAAVGIAHVGLDGKWLRVNGRLCEIVGYPRDELLSTTFQDLTHPDDLGIELGKFDAMMRGEISGYQMQKRYFTKRGRIVWVNLTTSLQRNKKGAPLYRISVIEDISERKQAEEALRRSEERLAAALRGGKLGVYDYDPRTRKVKWDRTVRSIWGVSSDEPVTYDTFAAGVHPDDLPAVEKALEAAIDPEDPRTYAAECRVIHKKSGKIRWVRAEGDVTFMDGEAVRLVGTVYDITRQRAAEEALRRSEAQFRLLADNMHQLAWMANTEGWTYWYNKRWFDYTGTTLEEMQGWGWREVHHPDHVDRVTTNIAESFRTGKPWEDTFPLRGKDGEYRWFLSRAVPVYDDDGPVVRWFGTSTDITERLKAEEHRELLVNELNHRVKNTLAVVQGIAHQTFKEKGGDSRDASKAFQQRLATLAAAHTLLTRSSWNSTTLNELAGETIRAACAPNSPVCMDGPPVVLGPKQAITFAMALHELCTNAIKYGALSVETGRVDVSWTLMSGNDGRRMKLVWRERGGPPVQPPHRRGFGLKMIEEALARELDGDVRMNFRPEGLVCIIEGSLDGLEGDS